MGQDGRSFHLEGTFDFRSRRVKVDAQFSVSQNQRGGSHPSEILEYSIYTIGTSR